MNVKRLLIAFLLLAAGATVGCADGGGKPAGGASILHISSYAVYDDTADAEAWSFSVIEQSEGYYFAQITGAVAPQMLSCQDIIAMPILSATQVQNVLKRLPIQSLAEAQALLEEASFTSPGAGTKGWRLDVTSYALAAEDIYSGLSAVEKASFKEVADRPSAFFPQPVVDDSSKAGETYAALNDEAAALLVAWAEEHRPECVR